ncbi:MAG TPA: FMN-binding protein [Dermatophilaceae bacterium]|nr:FMN-binding protein [Dermatophilaceae bacterium]
MRRIALALLSTITTVVLLFSYHTSTNRGTGTAAAVVQQQASGAQSGTAQSGTAQSGAAQSGSQQQPQTKTYTGDVVQTRWGPVQVELTVTGGRVTAADAVQYPDGNRRDAEINSYALPILSQQVLDRQSAQVDTVSGATVTSDGYRQSLQSAIDQAHL